MDLICCASSGWIEILLSSLADYTELFLKKTTKKTEERENKRVMISALPLSLLSIRSEEGHCL